MVSGCAKPHGPPVVLVVSRDQSDTLSLNPSRLQIAAQLSYKEHANLGHHHFDLDFYHYSGDEKLAMSQVEEYLRSNHRVIALVGDIGSSGTAMLADIADRLRIPHLSFFATDENVFAKHQYSFSYRPNLAHETQATLSLIQQRFPDRGLAVISSTVSNIANRWDALRQADSSIAPVHFSSYDRDATDFRPFIERISRDERVGAILIFLATTQLEHLFQQLAAAGSSLPVLVAPISLVPEALPDLIDIGAPVYSTVQSVIIKLYTKQDHQLNDFASLYRIAMGNHRLDTLGLWVYDGMAHLCQLVAISQSREDLRSNLANWRGQRLVGYVGFSSSNLIDTNPFAPVLLRDGQMFALEGH